MKRLILMMALTIISFASKGQEIITCPDQIRDGEWIIFAKDFDLKSTSELNVRIAADTKYWLWLNEKLIIREGGLKRGPTPEDSYIDVFNYLDGLKSGHNRVVVLVEYYGKNSFSHRPSAVAGLYFELKTKEDTVYSDGSWYAQKYEAMYAPEDENPEGDRRYRCAGANVGYDARKAFDLTDKNLNLSSWKRAVVVSREASEWGDFQTRPIPQWKWSKLKDYTVQNRTEEEYIGKLPYNAHVCPYMKIKAKGGEKINICTDDYWIGKARSFHAEYIAKKGVQEFEVPIWINGHEVIYTIPKGVEVLELKWRESGYNSEFAGTFECDNEFFNTLWEKAKRTLYVTMRDNYMDCPDRERAQWWGDAVVELGEAAYVFDPRGHLLTRKAIHELMNWQHPDGVIASPVPGWYRSELPCQMLASVGYYGFDRYYMITGDSKTIKDVYLRVRKYLWQVWDPHNNGLVRVRKGGWYWGDWGKNIDKEALQQLWYALAMEGFSHMGHVSGHRTDSLTAMQMREKLLVTFRNKYWNGKHYATPSYKGEPDDRVQAMAVLSGVATREQYPIFKEFFKEHYNASPYMEKYVLEALCKMGYYEDALERLQKRFKEMVESEYSTLWEGWEYTGGRGMKYKSGNGTYNHAWSGGGLTILSQYIAGIDIVEPAFRKFSVCPNLGSLKWINTAVPTTYGLIGMRAERMKKQLNVTLLVPEGTTACINIPAEYKKIVLNGRSYNHSIILEDGEYSFRFE